VIHEVDESLRAFVRREAVAADIEVVFDAPTKEWASRRNQPAVDLYLYDVREDLRRRENGRVDRVVDGVVVERLLPPRWFKLSYLATAWTQRPEDEHRLLSALLSAFLRFDALPPDLRSGSLGNIELPIPMSIALPPPEDRALSDVWSALGGELKPSLDLVVIAPFDLSRPFTAGPPVTAGPKLIVHRELDDGTPLVEEVGHSTGTMESSAEGNATAAPTGGDRTPGGTSATGGGSPPARTRRRRGGIQLDIKSSSSPPSR
jgi:hypothetical protein